MKKLLVLTLVLGIASLATAALSFTAPAEVEEGAAYQLVISGLAGDVAVAGLYASDYGAAGIPTSVDVLPAAGNLGTATIIASYGGFDFVIDDLLGDGTLTGDMIIANMIAGPAGTTLTMDLWDYNNNSAVTPGVAVIDFVAGIPEPATMALLGLGALVLRRKK